MDECDVHFALRYEDFEAFKEEMGEMKPDIMNMSADGNFIALTWQDAHWDSWKGFSCLRDFAESTEHDLIVTSSSEIFVEECDLGIIGTSSPGIFTSEEMIPLFSEGYTENINSDIRIRENAITDCIVSLMKNTGKTPREAMNLLGVPQDEWDFYEKRENIIKAVIKNAVSNSR